MSQETSAWAKEQQCGDCTLKAVLREIANWARPDGLVEFLSVRRIAEVVEVSPRTVQRAIAQLEPRQTDDDPDEKRLGLIRRVERFREDGGQGPCGFELVGYQPPLSVDPASRQAPALDCTRPFTPGDKMSPPPDTGVTPPGDKMSGEGVSPVSPLKRDKNILPLSPSDEGDVPPADLFVAGGGETVRPAGRDQAKPHPLPDGWKAPKVDDLQPEARGLVKQWPAGAYAAQCANFINHWSDTGAKNRRKSNWDRALANWLIRVHAEVMRAAKAGVSFEACAPRPDSAARKAEPMPDVAAKAKEDARSQAIHNRLRSALSDTAWAAWIRPCAIIVDPDAAGVVIIAPSRFAADWIERNHDAAIRRAAGAVLFEPPRWTRFEVENRAIGKDHHGQVDQAPAHQG